MAFMEVFLYNIEISQTPIDPIVLTDGKQIYDLIMQEIEPELMTDQMPLLMEKYKDETPEAKKARGARYTNAFAEYDKRSNAFFVGLETQVDALKKKAFASAEQKNHEEEITQLQLLESQISS
ncbi:MAG: hypothetical protein Greene041662_275 [Candidatus Peregrinibacteria bacterium Greene0416_62]|nr:MAG: hypothetical protein Greene041662_275 [Candidatus Peregrinibacteria bacterium Greene0416_62]TSC98979.1 MAG: hypothetical protein Greene101449_762 [Candidatus Peregrinibacteria bacterium Greene1014_49]